MQKGTKSNGKTITVKVQAQYYLVEAGLTQIETAKLLGVTRGTIGRWSKKHGWDILVKEKQQLGTSLADPDSLNHFIPFCRIKFPQHKETLMELVEHFKNSISIKHS